MGETIEPTTHLEDDPVGSRTAKGSLIAQPSAVARRSLDSDEAISEIDRSTKIDGKPTTHLEDDPVGFATFYKLAYERDIPIHAFRWVRLLYEARANRKGMVIEAFRGSSKSNTIATAFLAFRIGLSPQDSFLLLGATAAAARQTAKEVADLIANNPGWKIAFPHVVPDKKVDWSMADGFEVKRTDMDYEPWRQLCSKTKGRDRTFVGWGYRSSNIVGLHPTGMLIADDIHNENNTRSVKEMDKAVAIITSNILPTINPNTWRIFIGTPWRHGDVLQYLKATETYSSVSTPIYTETDSSLVISREGTPPSSSLRGAAFEPLRGESGRSNLESSSPIQGDSDVPQHNSVIPSEGASQLFNASARRGIPIESIEESTQLAADQSSTNAPSHQSANAPSHQSTIAPTHQATDPWSYRDLTWPERFPIHEIENYRRMVGEREFARMYLLDLSAAEGINLKAEWLQKVSLTRVDPSWPIIMGVDYASTADKQRDKDHDYFAVAIGAAQPNRSGIILIDGYRGHLSHAEAQDKLLELVSYYPHTEVIGIEAVSKGEEFYQSLSSHPQLPIQPMNPGGKGKGPRYQKVMAPLFERGWARISDKESPFMQAFRREWLRWPWTDHDDTLDAVYWMLWAGQSHLPPHSPRSKHPNPFTALGRT